MQWHKNNTATLWFNPCSLTLYPPPQKNDCTKLVFLSCSMQLWDQISLHKGQRLYFTRYFSLTHYYIFCKISIDYTSKICVCIIGLGKVDTGNTIHTMWPSESHDKRKLKFNEMAFTKLIGLQDTWIYIICCHTQSTALHCSNCTCSTSTSHIQHMSTQHKLRII